MPKRRQKKVESVHARTKRAIEEARLKGSPAQESVRKSIDLPESPQLSIEYTLNWEDLASSPLVPNLATEDEFPDTLERLFVNTLAHGESSPKLDKEMIERSPKRFYELTLEGIKRWHTHGKER